MDKLVRRVTVVEGSGGNRHAKVVYENEDYSHEPALHPIERVVRHLLKADLIRAQEAYQSHLDSAAKGSDAWLADAPRNIAEANRKGLEEARKAWPSEEDEQQDD
jgi:hypothetical protein